jgi:hypothetical protein
MEEELSNFESTKFEQTATGSESVTTVLLH